MAGLLRAADAVGDGERARLAQRAFAQYKSRYAAELLLHEQREVVEHLSMVKMAVLARPWLASTGSSGCI